LAQLLIVEDEETLRESLQRLFQKEGHTVDVAESAEQALPLLQEGIYDVVISDIILPGRDGIEMMQEARDASPETMFIIITAYASLDTAVKALRAGAYDYIMKPIIHEEIKQVVRNALRQKALLRENLLLRKEIDRSYDFSAVIGQSAAIKALLQQVKDIAQAPSNVLIQGETGTGKELFARVIHYNSPRKDAPFVPINCSAIPENLLESELFGHVRGAFTGAVTSRKGLLEEAEGGTVFLDEIGDIPQSFQIKLLRVLEEKELRPLGSSKSKRADLRFITATNKDLKEMVQKGLFREDLFYRINVITLHLPPLRERPEDIPLLVEYYLRKYCQELGRPMKKVSPEAMNILLSYPWPGNVRELQNVLERAALISKDSAIGPQDLPEDLKAKTPLPRQALQEALSIEEYTKAFITHYQHLWTEQELADRLGITRKTLWEKRKKWGLPRPPRGGNEK
jgi:DNA-binding NtrC family response regulator